jgi:hypothetical protein
VSLRDQLQEIYDTHGKLTPELVVAAARPKDHPLHGRVFDRKPEEAAEVYYRERARDLIRSVRVTYRAAADGVPSGDVRAFQAIRSDGVDEYVFEPAEKVAADPLLRALVLRDMEREWKQLRERYERFAEFIEMVEADLHTRV